jgi:hypothetical protein
LYRRAGPGGKTVATYRANLEGLKPETHYLYRAGDGKNWGEWFEFRTAVYSELAKPAAANATPGE